MAHEISEFWASTTADTLRINNEPSEEIKERLKTVYAVCIEPAEIQFQAKANIRSGYRCPELNAAVFGALNSQHVRGEAFDFTIAGVDLRELFDWLKNYVDFDQLILEPTWVHVSYNTSGSNRGEILRARRVDGKMKYEKVA